VLSLLSCAQSPRGNDLLIRAGKKLAKNQNYEAKYLKLECMDFFFFFLFFSGTGLVLARQAFYHLSHTVSPHFIFVGKYSMFIFS
jgi:hypothetical protein